MRHTGIPIIGDVPWGTHFCQFYRNKQDLIDILVPYFKAGLESNEVCLWVTSEPLSAQEAKAALGKAVEDLESYIRKGQIDFLDNCEWNRVAGKVESALARGFEGLRLKSDHESGVDRVSPQSRMLAISTYSLTECHAAELLNLVGNHAFALIKRADKWQILECAERKKFQTKERDSEERLRMAVASTGLGIWDFDPRSGALICSDLCKRHFGLPPERDVDYDTFLRCLHRDDRDRMHQIVQEVLRPGSGGLFDTEYRTVGLEDGEERWIAAVGRAFFDRDGRAVRFIGTTLDVTERKRAEEILKRTQASVDGGAEMVAWFTPDGKVQYANDATCRSLEYPREELLQLNALDFCPGMTWEQYREHWEEVRNRKSFTLELTYRRKDGSEYPAEVLVNYVVYGGQEYIFTYGRDITERKCAEAALRASEARLRRSQEIAHLGSWELDLKSNRLTWSDEVYRIFGLQPQEFGATYAAFLERVHPDDRAAVDASYSESLRDGRDFYEIEHRVVRKNSDEIRYVHEKCQHVRDSEGRIVLSLGMVHDVTERKRVEEALRESEQRLAAVTENLSEGLIIADSDGRVMHWNTAALAMFGYASMAECRRDLADFADTFEFRPLHEDLPIPVADWPLSRVLRGDVLRDWEVRLRRLDQGWEKIFAYSGWLIRSASGERLAFVSVTDTSARKQAENALAASESRLRALLESASQGVVAVDEQGRMILVNAKIEEMFGYTRDELLGQPLSILLPEHYREAHAEHMLHYFAKPRTRAMGLGLTLVGRFKDGAHFPLEVSLSCIEEGGTPLALALVTDITERKKAEERLWQAQKLESIGLLAGGVAHDFNNLLVGVIGNASLAREMIGPAHESVELLNGVIRTGEQLAHLTRQMLAYSGKGRFLVEPLDLSDLLPEMSGLVQPSIPKKIAIRLDLEPHLPLVETDRGQLQQIFMNLVINAAEAIGSDAGLISVRTGNQKVDEGHKQENAEGTDLPPGNYVTLEVTDTGCGMDEATKARIFDPFYSTKFTGRGLGLAAVAGIVRSHRGAIRVSSTPGEGSRFKVFFPASKAQAKVTVPHTLGSALHGTGTILVVDDEQAVRELTKMALERYGYKVLLAHNGMEAIDMFKRHPGDISLVILDLSMPEMGGDEALPELRKLRPEVRVMISSGYSESETMAFFRGQLVSGFVQKPYTITALAEKVKAMLS